MSEVYVVKGNTDLMIYRHCNFTCSNCSEIDFTECGIKYGKTNETMSLQDVKDICNKCIRNKIKFESLTLLGGEPTMHPQFAEIVNHIFGFKRLLYERLRIFTNGTGFTKNNVELMKRFDKVFISIYPSSTIIEEEMEKTGLANQIRSQTNLTFVKRDEFYSYGEEDPNLEYDKDLNWKRCTLKDECKTLTKKGFYRCFILKNKGLEACELKQEDMKEYTERTEPFDYCEFCPFPPLTKEWKNNHPDHDQKSVDIGVQRIRNLTSPLRILI